MLSSAKWMAPSRAPSRVASTTNGNSFTRNECALANIDKARLLRNYNYVDEIASWLDMFDNQRHFAIVLPRLALHRHALFYSLLSISSGQMERIDYLYPSAETLELYQQSIQHLLPSNWRRHLEGCAALFSSARINGYCGGLGQSLFWYFARMDLSSAVIGEEPTIIRMQDWIPPGMSLNAAGELFRAQPSYDIDGPTTGSSFDAEWEMLWNELRIWVEQRPVELKHGCRLAKKIMRRSQQFCMEMGQQFQEINYITRHVFYSCKTSLDHSSFQKRSNPCFGTQNKSAPFLSTIRIMDVGITHYSRFGSQED